MKSYDLHVVMFGNMPLDHDTVEKSDNVLISDSGSTDHPYDHSIAFLRNIFKHDSMLKLYHDFIIIEVVTILLDHSHKQCA